LCKSLGIMRGWLIALFGIMAVSLAVVGCSVASDTDSASSDVKLGTPPGPGLPCDVAEVFERNCNGCHAAPPIYGAPMSLGTWEQTQAPSSFNPNKKVFEAVAKRIHATTRPMPPQGQMNAADLAIIDSWIAAGTPRNNISCNAEATPDAGADAAAELGCTPDQTLVPSTKWTVTGAADVSDEYVCYGIDITNDQKRHAIAIAPVIDNKTVLHHMDLFQADESYGAEPRACSPFDAPPPQLRHLADDHARAQHGRERAPRGVLALGHQQPGVVRPQRHREAGRQDPHPLHLDERQRPLHLLRLIPARRRIAVGLAARRSVALRIWGLVSVARFASE